MAKVIDKKRINNSRVFQIYSSLIAGRNKVVSVKEYDDKIKHPFWQMAHEDPKKIKIAKEDEHGSLFDFNKKLATMQATHDMFGTYDELGIKRGKYATKNPFRQLLFHVLEEKFNRKSVAKVFSRFKPEKLLDIKSIELPEQIRKLNDPTINSSVVKFNSLIDIYNSVHKRKPFFERKYKKEIRKALSKYKFNLSITEQENWKLYSQLCAIIEPTDAELQMLGMLNPKILGTGGESGDGECKGKGQGKPSEDGDGSGDGDVSVDYNDLKNELNKQGKSINEQQIENKLKKGSGKEKDEGKNGKSGKAKKPRKDRGTSELIDRRFKGNAEPKNTPDEQKKVFTYNEWNSNESRYMIDFCRLREMKSLRKFYNNFVSYEAGKTYNAKTLNSIIERNGYLVERYRRILKSATPEMSYKSRNLDGDRINVDAMIDFVIDKKTRGTPNEKIYDIIVKKKFDLSILFLIDLSASGGTVHEHDADLGNVTAFDMIRATMLLLLKTCSGLIPNIAICGYSGRTEKDVRYLVLKDFNDRDIAKVSDRIYELMYCSENRDGCAIRHSTSKLVTQNTKGKVMITVSDFYPSDTNYSPIYGTEDVKLALREAVRKDVLPFGVIVDHDYSSLMPRKLDNVYPFDSYTKIHNVEEQPEKIMELVTKLALLYKR